MKTLLQIILNEGEADTEIKIGDYQTKHYHMCPGAKTLYQDIEDKVEDMDLAVRTAKLQDALFALEMRALEHGAVEADVDAAELIADQIIAMAAMLGLEKEHNYIQGHVDKIKGAVENLSEDRQYSAKNAKSRMKISQVIKDLIIEGKLSDYGTNNTPAALKKEKEITGKKVDPMDSIEDLDLNTLSRNTTVKEYRYGPLNPFDKKGSEKFWKDKAEMWDTTVEHAKTSTCSNCVAFNQKPATLKKMAKAIGEQGEKIVKEANLGFCEFFWFKCAGARTCDAWVGGGPLK